MLISTQVAIRNDRKMGDGGMGVGSVTYINCIHDGKPFTPHGGDHVLMKKPKDSLHHK